MERKTEPSPSSPEFSINAPAKIEIVRGNKVSLLYAPRRINRLTLQKELYKFQELPGPKVCLIPGMVLPWEEFCLLFPAGSIAGDGSVDGGSKIEPDHVNYDHHDETHGSRISQKSMCEVVVSDLRRGKLEHCRDQKTKALNPIVFINHLDGDNGLAIAAIALFDELDGPPKKRLAHLAWMEGRTDAHAGVIDLPPREAKELKWWVNPITDARRRHGWLLEDMDPYARLEVLEEIISNTQAYADDNAKIMELDERLELIHAGNGWNFFREIGDDARRKIRREYGLRPFISSRGANLEGNLLYSVCNLVDNGLEEEELPLESLFSDLNRMELLNSKFHKDTLPIQWKRASKLELQGTRRVWGGKPVGGSFAGGSRLSERQLIAFIDGRLGAHESERPQETVQNYLEQERKKYKNSNAFTFRGWR